jgi:hypothetical protein
VYIERIEDAYIPAEKLLSEDVFGYISSETNFSVMKGNGKIGRKQSAIYGQIGCCTEFPEVIVVSGSLIAKSGVQQQTPLHISAHANLNPRSNTRRLGTSHAHWSYRTACHPLMHADRDLVKAH